MRRIRGKTVRIKKGLKGDVRKDARRFAKRAMKAMAKLK
ncbi:MAG: hypothetical protein QOE83_13 [Actinomycetota bacterium]|nr:hypothetical protein [Actinomycetota bacterium]